MQLENGAACAFTLWMGATDICIACTAYARSSYDALTSLVRAAYSRAVAWCPCREEATRLDLRDNLA